MELPFTTFVGFLKQVDVARLGALEIAALDAALPHFRSLDAPREHNPHQFTAMYAMDMDALANAKKLQQSVPNRRFSGGADLPRGRYYTLAKADSGDDDATLAAEMSAYRSVRQGNLSYVVDFRDPPEQPVSRALPAEVFGNRSLGICFAENHDYDNSFLAVIKSRLGDCRYFSTVIGTGKVSAAWIEIPYAVTYAEKPGVIDLRRLSTQQWFADTFGRPGNGTGVFVTFDQSAEFADFLPWMMSMELGGSGFTEGVGRFLRRNGATGLIYPSARNDAHAIQRDGALTKASGWCFVDYRDAAAGGELLLDYTEQTPFPFDRTNTRVLAWDEAPDAGSWATEGIRQFYRHRYCSELYNVIGAKAFESLARDFLP